MMRALALRTTGAVALSFLGCGGDPESVQPAREPEADSDEPGEAVCVPGTAEACECEDGSAGAQLCSEDGETHEACECDAPDPDPAPAGCEQPSAGFAPLPRLTRSQYANTVEDLIGVDASAVADSLVADERIGPFTSNVGVPVAELQLEEYMVGAETIAATAVQDLAALVPCAPSSGDRACADAFVRDLLPRAFRRPVTDAEAQSIVDVYEAGIDFETGIRIALQAVLQSPYFLYRVELGDTEAGLRRYDRAQLVRVRFAPVVFLVGHDAGCRADGGRGGTAAWIPSRGGRRKWIGCWPTPARPEPSRGFMCSGWKLASSKPKTKRTQPSTLSWRRP